MKSWNASLIELIGGNHICSDEDARVALIELLGRVKQFKITKWKRFRAAHRQENPLIYRVCIPQLYFVYNHLQGKRYMCACNDMEDVLYSMAPDDIGILVNIIKVLEAGLYEEMEVPWFKSVNEIKFSGDRCRCGEPSKI